MTIVLKLLQLSIYRTMFSKICYNNLGLGGRLSERMDRTITRTIEET